MHLYFWIWVFWVLQACAHSLWCNHATLVVTAPHVVSDYRLQLVARARDEAASYREFYGHPIPGKVLAERVAGFVHAYTMYWSVRPFGASILIITVEDKTPSIWMVEPSGLTYSYTGCAIGKGKQVCLHTLCCVTCFYLLALVARWNAEICWWWCMISPLKVETRLFFKWEAMLRSLFVCFCGISTHMHRRDGWAS